MSGARFTGLLCLILALLAGGCANIVPPGGGTVDKTPPKLRSVSPPDSQRMTRVSKIELQFDEYIALSDAANQVQISPLLPLPLNVTATPKRVIITIPDTLLQEETTYRISFGNAIRDLHEGNIFPGKGYTFSTGAYFDSLSIQGTVIDARTGLPDTAAFVMLYKASEGDSAVVRHKPMYVTRVDGSGAFTLSGLPPRTFRLYALRDANSNLIFDGGKEWIAFEDSLVRPAETSHAPYRLNTFPETMGDTAASVNPLQDVGFGARGNRPQTNSAPATGYRVLVDTGDVKKRSQDITQPITILFAYPLSTSINTTKIFLTVDSAGTAVEEAVHIVGDSLRKDYKISTAWREDAVYTLRLQKGFAKDSAGADLLPGRYTFRTKRDEDYGKLRIHLPTKYFGHKNILQVSNERDTIYQQPVTDSMVALLHIPPGTYTLRIIVDANENGRWDAGDLFMRRQPEVVVPYSSTINLKAGWEQQVDFEAPRSRKLGLGSGADAGNPLPK